MKMLVAAMLLATAGTTAAAPAYRVTIGRITVHGNLALEHILTRFEARMPALTTCYVERLSTAPTLAGTLQARVLIDHRGRLTDVKLTSIFDVKLTACVRRVLHTLKFRAPTGGGMVMIFAPLAFSPS